MEYNNTPSEMLLPHYGKNLLFYKCKDRQFALLNRKLDFISKISLFRIINFLYNMLMMVVEFMQEIG